MLIRCHGTTTAEQNKVGITFLPRLHNSIIPHLRRCSSFIPSAARFFYLHSLPPAILWWCCCYVIWPRFESRKWPRGNGYIRLTKAALKADVPVVLFFVFFFLLPFFPLASHDATSACQVPRRPLLWTSNRDDDAKQWMWWKRLGPDSACLAARWLLAFFIFLSPSLRRKKHRVDRGRGTVHVSRRTRSARKS